MSEASDKSDRSDRSDRSEMSDASAESNVTYKPIRVLFLCVGNSCRSQMAEALLRHLGGERFDVHSAGSIPVGVHPKTIQALAEIGIDAGRQRSKHWSVYLDVPPFDYVIAVCEPESQNCPIAPVVGERLHWPFDDPFGVRGTDEEQMNVFRRVRDQIAERIRQFVHDVTGR